MISNKSVANAVGGKTARACDSCIRKRARWYCAADDAFLCQACDSSVHSANSLARRHHRVRLKTSSLKRTSDETPGKDNSAPPTWHRGFTRKARTPRHGKNAAHQLPKTEEPMRNIFHLVPEVGADETSLEENEEEQLLYRVPVFDPFVSELCTSTTSNEPFCLVTDGIESKPELANYNHELNSLHGFLPSDLDTEEFAADVESLLGRGLENECLGMEELGLMDSPKECSLSSEKVKVEEDQDGQSLEQQAFIKNYQLIESTEIDMMKEQFELNFEDYDDTLASCAEDEGGLRVVAGDVDSMEMRKYERKTLLRLDCDAVITAWGSQGPPWSMGKRPDFEPDDCWPHCSGACGVESHHLYGDFGGIQGHPAAMADGGREARVSRYREKRRTRLFSKKIRYEVRKLNAEKRPRMKGRFVKRTSFAAPSGFHMLNK